MIGPTSKLPVAGVIVEYKDAAGAVATAARLLEEGCAEVLVVSTGPAAASVPHGVRSLPRPDNPGFAAALNAGVAALVERVDYVLVTNTDLTILPGTLPALLAAASTVGAAQIAPAVVLETGEVEWDGGRVDHRTCRIVHERYGLPPRQSDPEPTDFVTGAFMLVRLDAWHSVGGMREDYFLYAEDVDFSMRLRAAGWSRFVAPMVHVFHESSGSIGKYSALQVYLMTRNLVRLFRSLGDSLWARTACWFLVPARALWRLASRRALSTERVKWILRGAVDARPGSGRARGKGRAAELLA